MYIAYHPLCSIPNGFISLSKPRGVVNCCYDPSFDKLIDIDPVTPELASSVHSQGYVREVFQEYLTGFGERDPQIVKQVTYANGAMVQAVKTAMDTGYCFAPVSGFHHAGYDWGHGYCTLNGIAISGLFAGGKVLVLDFDAHYGDGTDDIISQSKLPYELINLTRGKPFKSAYEAIDQAKRAIVDLKPSLVIYQAGADSHITDSYNCGYFDDSQWDFRDIEIFQTCKKNQVPIVWNLAGGYSGKATILLHARTFQSACLAFEPNHPCVALSPELSQ